MSWSYPGNGSRQEWIGLAVKAAKGLLNVVVVHTLDRWSRNLKVLLESVSILNQHNVGLVSITENID